MQQQLDEQNIPFEFIKAVDGSTLTDEYLAKVCDFEELAKQPHLMHRGAQGCLLSHYSIYQKIIAEDLPYALVLEDDVEIQPNFKAILAALEGRLKANEAVLLFTQNNFMPTVFSKQNLEKLSGPYELSYPMEPWALGSAAGYVISREAAQSLLDFVLPMRYAADAWGAYYYKKAIHNVRCVTPFPVKPAGFKSNIDYVPNTGILGKILEFVNDNEIFPFNKLLLYRRKRLLRKATQYSFAAEPSPVAAVPAA